MLIGTTHSENIVYRQMLQMLQMLQMQVIIQELSCQKILFN